jgi:hypothetical protein
MSVDNLRDEMELDSFAPISRRRVLGGLAAASLLHSLPSFSRSSDPGTGAQVVLMGGRASLLLDREPVPPVIYALTHCPGYRFAWEERPLYSISEFARLGVPLVQVEVYLEQMWPAPEHFDISIAQKQIRGILDASPDAAIMLRLHVMPPQWWTQAHPQECVGWAGRSIEPPRPSWASRWPHDTDLQPVVRHSMASRRWLKDCGEKTGEFCRLLAASAEGRPLFCIQIAAGVFGEWHYYDFIDDEPDTGPAMSARFREWLTAKYGARLPFEATVPGTAERRRSDGYLRDPHTDRRVIDYLQCQHETVTDAFIHFCRTVKENWPRKIATAGFHGYWFSMNGKLATGGHLAIRRALESPYVDIVCGPQSYDHAAAGLPGISRGLTDSARVHGKLWLDEMDTMPASWDLRLSPGVGSARSIADLRACALASLTRGTGLWYYDLVCMQNLAPTDYSAGMWDTQTLQSEIARIESLRRTRLRSPLASVADVLAVFDTESVYLSGHDRRIDPVSLALLDGTARDLYYSGAAFHMVYFSDLEKMDLTGYKAVIFANVYYVNAARRALLAEKVALRGTHLIWSCAAGYFDDTGCSVERIAATVGMNITRVEGRQGRVLVSGNSALDASFGIDAHIDPLFAVRDDDVQVLGKIKDTDAVGLARKTLKDYTSWYSSVPALGSTLLRYILREAGCHIYTDSGDALFAGSGIVLAQSREGGRRTFRLLSGKEVTLQAAANSTVVLDAQDGRALL